MRGTRAGEGEGVAAEGGRQVGTGEQFLHEQGGAGGVAAVGQGERTAVEQVVVAGIEFVQTACGELEGEGGMALLEQEAGEAAEQLRSLQPNTQVPLRATEGEQVEYLCVLVGELFEDRGGGWLDGHCRFLVHQEGMRHGVEESGGGPNS